MAMENPSLTTTYFLLIGYVQINQNVQAAIIPVAPGTFPFSWTFVGEVSESFSLNIVVYTYLDIIDEQSRRMISNLALEEARKHIAASPMSEAIATGEFPPKPTEEDFAKLKELEELRTSLQRVKRSQGYLPYLQVPVREKIYPDFPLHQYTQAKFKAAQAVISLVANPPFDDHKVDQTFPFRILHPYHQQILDWLSQGGVPANPFYADWIWLLQGGVLLPAKGSGQRFFDHLVHCFHVEAQLVVNQHFYEEMKFSGRDSAPALLSDIIVQEGGEPLSIENIPSPRIEELYARNSFDFHVIMTRALWDKIVRLACLAVGINPNVESIDVSLNKLEEVTSLAPLSKTYLAIFVRTARKRLEEDAEKGGWLRPTRDAILHKTGLHSSGVLPQAKSVTSLFDMWERSKDEHNWLREAFLVLLISLLINAYPPGNEESN